MIGDEEVSIVEEQISVLSANNVFLIGIVALFGLNIFTKQFFAGNRAAAEENFNTIALVTEFLFIMMPGYLYVLLSGKNVKKVLRLYRLSFWNMILSVAAIICAYPGIIFINFILHIVIDKIGTPIPPPVFDLSSFPKLMVGIAIIAGSAGICEEVMFRGVILRGYEKYGKVLALIISSALFSIMHMDIQKMVPIFILALLIGYLVQRTNSIYAGMIAHFINNSISVVVMFVFGYFAKIQGTSLEEMMKKQQTMQVPDSAYIIAGAGFFFIALVFTAALAGILMLLRENTKNNQIVEYATVEQNSQGTSFGQFVPLIPGISLICLRLAQEAYYILSIPIPEWMKMF